MSAVHVFCRQKNLFSKSLDALFLPLFRALGLRRGEIKRIDRAGVHLRIIGRAKTCGMWVTFPYRLLHDIVVPRSRLA